MTQQELTLHNLGQSLDDLANLDPRGYGVCKILYDASRKYTGSPTSMNAARKLVQTVKDGDIVYIMADSRHRRLRRGDQPAHCGADAQSGHQRPEAENHLCHLV